jgi:hypothetical protein
LALVWLTCLLVPSRAFCAAPVDQPQVFVVFLNVAKLSAGLVERAQTEVSRIFKEIDIEIVWVAEIPRDYQRVRVLSVTGYEPSSSEAAGTVLGFTQTVPEGRGTRAYVFYPRIVRMAQKFNVMLEKLLAVAMAHELGHMLMPDASHGAQGIMRAPWDYFDLRAASNGRLRFSKESAGLIRLQAASSTQIVTRQAQAR